MIVLGIPVPKRRRGWDRGKKARRHGKNIGSFKKKKIRGGRATPSPSLPKKDRACARG